MLYWTHIISNKHEVRQAELIEVPWPYHLPSAWFQNVMDAAQRMTHLMQIHVHKNIEGVDYLKDLLKQLVNWVAPKYSGELYVFSTRLYFIHKLNVWIWKNMYIYIHIYVYIYIYMYIYYWVCIVAEKCLWWPWMPPSIVFCQNPTWNLSYSSWYLDGYGASANRSSYSTWPWPSSFHLFKRNPTKPHVKWHQRAILVAWIFR